MVERMGNSTTSLYSFVSGSTLKWECAMRCELQQ
jgi:hypothetical protein